MTEILEAPPELWLVTNSEEGTTYPVRFGTDEQLDKLQKDMYAQYTGYRAQAMELLGKAENALCSANLLAYELDRRARVKLNGSAQ